MTFLDIDDSLNNSELSVIIGALRRLGKQYDILNWISKVLLEKIINPTLETSRTIRTVGRGTPKNGELFSIL